MSHQPWLPSLSSLVALVCCATLVISTCYRPDGTSLNGTEAWHFEPCVSDSDVVSMCCQTNRTNPPGGPLSAGLTADICLPNGMCQNSIMLAKDSGSYTYYKYTRGQCTSRDWSGGCLNVCMDPEVYILRPPIAEMHYAISIPVLHFIRSPSIRP